ncbi:hypothetical protein PFTANZ_02191 [Plasmodium falciparum Tanzania (2000708)]|uniref:Uncharacterized protein n=1 Tax=Plasmodium falciparum Tanzania (2000708) TaxID=1036725 RepID=A0A024W887_PLAFA|nr:hypothetical protein PFTANZ_02191 [Plasmodium falciparum Tanzania (2000708)]
MHKVYFILIVICKDNVYKNNLYIVQILNAKKRIYCLNKGKETAKNLSFIFYTTNIHKKYNK